MRKTITAVVLLFGCICLVACSGPKVDLNDGWEELQEDTGIYTRNFTYTRQDPESQLILEHMEGKYQSEDATVTVMIEDGRVTLLDVLGRDLAVLVDDFYVETSEMYSEDSDEVTSTQGQLPSVILRGEKLNTFFNEVGQPESEAIQLTYYGIIPELSEDEESHSEIEGQESISVMIRNRGGEQYVRICR